MTEAVAPVAPAGAPAPAPAAPAAPVAAPAPAPAAPLLEQPPKAAPAEKGFTPTGEPSIDLALSFFAKHGLTENSPEVQEAAKGNFQYLKAKLAELGGKAQGWEQYLALAEKGYTDFQNGQKAALESRQKAVYEAVGGEENWNSIQTWAETNGTPEELAEFKAGIAQGGFVAQAVAKLLSDRYASASGTTLEPAAATTEQPNAPMQGAPLTKAGYRAEVAALQAKVGAHAMDSSPEYAALRTKYARVFG